MATVARNQNRIATDCDIWWMRRGLAAAVAHDVAPVGTAWCGHARRRRRRPDRQIALPRRRFCQAGWNPVCLRGASEGSRGPSARSRRERSANPSATVAPTQAYDAVSVRGLPPCPGSDQRAAVALQSSTHLPSLTDPRDHENPGWALLCSENTYLSGATPGAKASPAGALILPAETLRLRPPMLAQWQPRPTPFAAEHHSRRSETPGRRESSPPRPPPPAGAHS